MLRFSTSGESHGRCLIAVLEGMVAGLRIEPQQIDAELARRQEGYGRGGRMQIEKDRAEILSGVRNHVTIGGPIALELPNRDFSIDRLPQIKGPRPGHADLAGGLKYDRRDLRDILERSSARETAARVAIGAVCKQFLKNFHVDILSHVLEVGGVRARTEGMGFESIRSRAAHNPVRCADPRAARLMIKKISAIQKARDTVGGVFEILVRGVVPGIGSFTAGERRLSAGLCAAVMSIQAVKGVEIGMGFGVARVPGSAAHDEIFYDKKRRAFYRKTNRAGGIEGGMSNGEPIILRAATKPLATLMKPLRSIDIDTKREKKAAVERSDVSVVPASGVVGEAMVAIELARGYLEKFGGDSLGEITRNYKSYVAQIRRY